MLERKGEWEKKNAPNRKWKINDVLHNYFSFNKTVLLNTWVKTRVSVDLSTRKRPVQCTKTRTTLPRDQDWQHWRKVENPRLHQLWRGRAAKSRWIILSLASRLSSSWHRGVSSGARLDLVLGMPQLIHSACLIDMELPRIGNTCASCFSRNAASLTTIYAFHKTVIS